MASAMLQSASHPNVHYLEIPRPKQGPSQSFADARQTLVNALHHVRASDSDLVRAMANTRRALDAIQDMRQWIN